MAGFPRADALRPRGIGDTKAAGLEPGILREPRARHDRERAGGMCLSRIGLAVHHPRDVIGEGEPPADHRGLPQNLQ